MITNDDVKYIASLSRIHLKEEEMATLRKDLEDILHYIEKLKKLDVSGVEPTTHPLPLKNVYREDRKQNGLSQEEALSMAVERKNGFFKVPKVIE